jgi:hypothetical protein
MPNSLAEVTAGAPNLANYTDNGDGTVTDNVTKLMWQKTPPPGTFIQPDASEYCISTLAGLGGHSDWRLPSLMELASLMDLGSTSATIATAFPSMFDTFWSSTSLAGSSGSWWVLDFGVPQPNTRFGGDLFDVRCVR